MTELLTRIFYYLYSRPFPTLLLYTVLLLLVWTALNYFLPKIARNIVNYPMAILITLAIGYYTIGRRSAQAEREITLTPFWSFTKGDPQEAWLNVFLFFPLGLSLPYILPEKVKHKVGVTILIAALFSLFIETNQFIFKLGLCETDDLLCNIFGALIGTLSFVIAEKLRFRKKF